MPEESDETSPSETMNTEHTSTEESDASPVSSESASSSETPVDGDPQRPLTPERVADVALGLGAVAFEALDRAARGLDATVRRVVEDAPAVIADLEEKGRPVREKIAEALRGRPTVTDAFTSAGDASSGTAGAGTDEISTLEQRVRELEQQVGERPAEPSPFSMLEIDAPVADASVEAEAAVSASAPEIDPEPSVDASEAAEGDPSDAPKAPEDGVG